MSEPLLIAKHNKQELFLLPQMASRHGLVTGATGTGKTVTLQTLFAKSVARAIGSTVGRKIIRGVLGSIFSGRR